MPPKTIENRKMYHNRHTQKGAPVNPSYSYFPISVAFRSTHHPCFLVNIASRTNIAALYRLCTSVVRGTYDVMGAIKFREVIAQ
jgi:hypothetical protein